MSFPNEAMQFYFDLRADNSREFWAANKHRYERHVREPLTEVMAGLAEEFGPAKIYRPYRDLRYSEDKTPYKTHQGAYVGTAPACGWYVEVNADEMSAGGGFYHADARGLAAYRQAVDDRRRGTELQAIVDRLVADGWQVVGEQLKRSPRGYPADHARVDLLRHKWLYVVHEIDPNAPSLAAVTEQVAERWRAARPLVAWASDVLAGGH